MERMYAISIKKVEKSVSPAYKPFTMFSFTLINEGSGTKCRLGRIQTSHGEFDTPSFMPVGTQGTVKAMTPEGLKKIGAQIILSNTYHLYLRPGHERIKRLGGLHKFMHWDGPILTDSGGFQILSLADLRKKLTEDGVEFQSHLDGGDRHFLTPELAIEIQEALGSDIMMVLDECLPYPADEKKALESMKLSLRWAKRCLDARTSDNALFGIVQGGMFPELRREYIKMLMEISTPHPHPLPSGEREKGEGVSMRSHDLTISRPHDFDGFAIGGLSVGEPIHLMYEMVDVCTEALPKDKPRYLMGVGTPEDLLQCIDRGVDLFDCVLPTRNARNGCLFTSRGDLNIRNAEFADDPRPVDEACSCETCMNYGRAYLRHLALSREILSSMLNTIHNLHFYLNLLERARLAIKQGKFGEFKREFLLSREVVR